MKKVILLLSLVPSLVSGQLSFTFEQGIPPGWVIYPAGEFAADNVNPLSGAMSIHHVYDNNTSGYAQAGFPTTNLRPDLGIVTWRFLVKHSSDPSSSNNWSVFLMADKGPPAMQLPGSVSGFAAGVNLNGYDDTLRIWKVNNGSTKPVLSSRVNWQTQVGTEKYAIIEISREQDGFWEIQVLDEDNNPLGNNSGRDNSLFAPGWCGVFYRYTSTRDRLLWIDDLSLDGIFREDTNPPSVIKTAAAGWRTVDIGLDEPAANSVLDRNNFTLNGKAGSATSVSLIEPDVIRISFSDELINHSSNEILIGILCDGRGNCTSNIKVLFNVDLPDAGDIVISEIMADPTPTVSLPPVEYIELFNNSREQVDAGRMKLIAGSQTYDIPSIILEKNEYIILCDSRDTMFFGAGFRKVPMKSFPSLNDDGKMLAIVDSSGKLIHCVNYSRDWYDDFLKASGGWSLEMVDCNFPFNETNNWRASSSPSGGTPGMKNSVFGINPDKNFEGIFNVFVADSASVLLTFTEPVKTLESVKEKISLTGSGVIEITPADITRENFILTTDSKIRGDKKIYTLVLPADVKDFAGNSPATYTCRFGIPVQPEARSVSFNELLFNPLPGDFDYFELYNNTDMVINLADLQVVSVNTTSGDTSSCYPVSSINRCLLPNELAAFSESPAKVVARYFSADPSRNFVTSPMPSMPDDKGKLVLLNRQLEVVDEVIYDEGMHFPLISNRDGIALEKISPVMSSLNRSAWHSASELSGWGTPGARNSVFNESPASDKIVTLSSSKITPDNDGNDDVLLIRFDTDGIDDVITLEIFDEMGNLVRRLAKTVLVTPGESLVWDGTGDDGKVQRRGIYVLLATITDSRGNSYRVKKVCAIIR
ncbi:MAG: lamin tail domain-containing protein [Bacteroidales bacterium]